MPVQRRSERAVEVAISARTVRRRRGAPAFVVGGAATFGALLQLQDVGAVHALGEARGELVAVGARR